MHHGKRISNQGCFYLGLLETRSRKEEVVLLSVWPMPVVDRFRLSSSNLKRDGFGADFPDRTPVAFSSLCLPTLLPVMPSGPVWRPVVSIRPL